MNSLLGLPFVLSTIINSLRKDIQPAWGTPMTDSIRDPQDKPDFLNQEITPENTPSGKIAPYYHAPKSEPILEAIKQEYLKNSNFTDDAKNFYSKIPIVSDNLETGAANMTMDPRVESYMTVDKKIDLNDKEMQKQILEHELLHATPKIPTAILPLNKKTQKDVEERWQTKDKNTVKEEQWAEQQLPSILYKYIFK